MRRVGESVLQKTFPPFPNASATLAQQHFQNGIGLHSGGHDDARRKGRHTGPDTADVIANHDETASELPDGHRNAAPPGHTGGGNHTVPGQQQCFDEILFYFGIIHGLDDANNAQAEGPSRARCSSRRMTDGFSSRKTAPSASTFGNPKCRGKKC